MQFTLSHTTRQLAPRLHINSIHMLQRFTSKISVDVEPSVLEDLQQEAIKPRKHPGVIKPHHIELPNQLAATLQRIVGDHPIKKVLNDGRLLNSYIKSRHPPPTPAEIENRKINIVEEINAKMPREKLDNLDEDALVRWQRKREQELNKRMLQRTYAWKSIDYGPYESIVYAVARGAQEYAVLKRVLTELSIRDAEFKPSSYIDFGAGIGTGMWVASELWRDSIYEYYNVDRSREMNELSELILRDGHDNKQITLKNVFYRQFLPAADTKYNLVVISHTLFELASLEERKEVLLNLWYKCDGYMVIVEEGTRRGSELVNEARSIILQDTEAGHTMAPCAHDLRCPRLTNQNDRTPCNFEISYTPLRLGTDATADRQLSLYSYVVLKKGAVTDKTQTWPRIVRPTLVRSKHAICRMCTSSGKLQEVIFTASKHGKPAYSCAKVSRWGDRLPISVGEPQIAEKPKSKTTTEEQTYAAM